MHHAAYAGMNCYSGIQDIMDVRHFSDAEDAVLMDRLGKTLVDHDVHDVLGINLLHTHFKLEFDEILVEMVEKDHVVSIPVKVSDLKVPVYPMTWRLARDSAVPLHWRVGVDSSGAKIQNFLAGVGCSQIRDLLGGDLNRFGIIRTSDFERNLKPSMTLLEESDVGQRILYSTESPPKSLSVQTAWHFGPTDVYAAGKRHCDKYTRRSCTRVCPSTGSEWGMSGTRHAGASHRTKIHKYHDRVSK